jgi:hypothetical protein
LSFLFCSQVLCEVEWNLICLNETTPAQVTEDFLSKTENWNRSPDDTGLMTQDWGVISLFEAYLTDWNVIVSNLNNKKKNGCKLTTPTDKKKKSKRQKEKGKKAKNTKDKKKKIQKS